MPHLRLPAALAAMTVLLAAAAVNPARAEFFGCNDRPGQVLYDSRWHHGDGRSLRLTRVSSVQPARSRRVTSGSVRRYTGMH